MRNDDVGCHDPRRLCVARRAERSEALMSFSLALLRPSTTRVAEPTRVVAPEICSLALAFGLPREVGGPVHRREG